MDSTSFIWEFDLTVLYNTAPRLQVDPEALYYILVNETLVIDLFAYDEHDDDIIISIGLSTNTNEFITTSINQDPFDGYQNS